MLGKLWAFAAFIMLSMNSIFGSFCAPCDCNWTGFYVGGNLGGSSHTFSIYDFNFAIGGDTQELKSNKFIGGGQIGYNYQFCQAAVVGLEASLDWVGDERKRDRLVSGEIESPLNTKLDYFGTIHARAGLTFDGFYFYFLGGAAYEKVKGSWLVFTLPDTPLIDLGNFLWGWTYGGGVEKCITSRLSLRAQVASLRFFDYTKKDSSSGAKFVINNNTLTALIGINYKFW